MPAKVVIVGSLNMDLVACAARIPVPGETITGHAFFDAPGGKGANQAYAVARLGGQASMLGRVGSDDFGRRLRENLERVGCEVSQLKTVAKVSSGIAVIYVADDGHNSIIIVPGANARLSPEDLEAAEDFLRGASLVLLQLENPLPAVRAAARVAGRVGARVILDPAPAPPQPLPDDLLKSVNILTPNETEAAILVGLKPGRLDIERATEIAARLRARGVETVILKLGERGCLLVQEGEPLLIPAPKVKAVDTTAAGDVFNGALAVALAEGAELVDACRFAAVSAALSVTRLGAQAAIPSRAEVDAFVAGLPLP